MRNEWENSQLEQIAQKNREELSCLVAQENPTSSPQKCRKIEIRKWKRAVENLFSHFPQFLQLLFARKKKEEVLIAAAVSGGVGDLIRFNAFFITLARQYPNVKVDIYTAHSAAKFIFAKLPNVRVVATERLYPWFESRYDAYFDMGQIVIPTFKTNVNPLPRLKEVSKEWTKVIQGQLQQYHRVLFPKLIELAEQRNWNFLEMLGRTGGLVGVGQAVPQLHFTLQKNPFAGKKYITFNTGWNKNDKFAPGVVRHTKCWPASFWSEWVRLFRQTYPQIEVLQLGENNSPRILEANSSLLGHTTLSQVATVLKDSLLHVDCDCGLMHLSYALGVKAVILFGPTNGHYLAYPGHIPLISPRCGNCWHLTRNWDQCCALYSQTVCMESITPQMVQDAVTSQLQTNL